MRELEPEKRELEPEKRELELRSALERESTGFALEIERESSEMCRSRERELGDVRDRERELGDVGARRCVYRRKIERLRQWSYVLFCK